MLLSQLTEGEKFNTSLIRKFVEDTLDQDDTWVHADDIFVDAASSNVDQEVVVTMSHYDSFRVVINKIVKRPALLPKTTRADSAIDLKITFYLPAGFLKRVAHYNIIDDGDDEDLISEMMLHFHMNSSQEVIATYGQYARNPEDFT